MKKLKVQAVMDNYETCMTFIEAQLQSVMVDNQSAFKILTACEEVIVNVINFAYPEGDGEIEIGFEDIDVSVAITITDSGKAFNPLQEPDPDIATSIEDRDIGGLGILMVKKLMDQIDYEYHNGQNRLTIVKRKKEE